MEKYVHANMYSVSVRFYLCHQFFILFYFHANILFQQLLIQRSCLRSAFDKEFITKY